MTRHEKSSQGFEDTVGQRVAPARPQDEDHGLPASTLGGPGNLGNQVLIPWDVRCGIPANLALQVLRDSVLDLGRDVRLDRLMHLGQEDAGALLQDLRELLEEVRQSGQGVRLKDDHEVCLGIVLRHGLQRGLHLCGVVRVVADHDAASLATQDLAAPLHPPEGCEDLGGFLSTLPVRPAPRPHRRRQSDGAECVQHVVPPQQGQAALLEDDLAPPLHLERGHAAALHPDVRGPPVVPSAVAVGLHRRPRPLFSALGPDLPPL
mmetsp:Transcript_2990/g.10325  ORF Transcript_2990/g.10325 Transcript_2990/m.10325 type:complete len:263 (+) Transcript_2990:409-1197(+)